LPTSAGFAVQRAAVPIELVSGFSWVEIAGGRLRPSIAKLKRLGAAVDTGAMEAIRQKATLTARPVWLATFVAPLILTVVLLGVRAEGAAGAPTPGSSVQVPSLEEELAEEREEEELEAREEELEAGEEVPAEEGFLGGDFLAEELGGTDCELAEEALEEGLLTPVDVDDLCTAEEEWRAEAEGHNSRARRSSRAGRKARSQCPLRSAKAHIVATRSRKRLRLRIGYTTSEPTKVRVEIRVGNRRLGAARRHVGRSGVLHITRRVGKGSTGKVRVRLRAPSCNRLRIGSAAVR